MLAALGCSTNKEAPDLAEPAPEKRLPASEKEPIATSAACQPEAPTPVGESQALLLAIGACDLQGLERAIAAGSDVNGLVQSGRTLLMPLAAAMRDCKKKPAFRLEAIKALYEAGAAPHLTPHDFEPRFGSSKSIFDSAIAVGSPEILEVLLQDPERILCLDRYRGSPLERALVSLQRTIKRMKQYPSARSTLKLKALQPMWDMLLSPRVIEELITKIEPTRLRRFILEGDVDLLELLKTHGINLESSAGEDGRSLAHHAVAYPEVGGNLLKTLAESNVALTRKDSAGVTPLMLAALHGKMDIVRTLLNTEVDLTAVSKNGWSAVSFSRAAGHEKIATLLEMSGGTDPLRVDVPLAHLPRLQLFGDPTMRALDAITDYAGWEHSHPNQLGKDGTTIINHGSIGFRPDATVAQVNEVLKARDATIGSMLSGVVSILVSIPAQPKHVDAGEVKRQFEAFAQVASYSPDHVMTNRPKYVDYESCSEAAKRVIDAKHVAHSEIAGCSSESFDLKGTGPVEHVIIQHGKGMDCPSGCFYKSLAVVIDNKGHISEVPRRLALRAESDLAKMALRFWSHHRKVSAKPDTRDVFKLGNPVECDGQGVPAGKPKLIKGQESLHWRFEMSRTYECWTMGRTIGSGRGTEKLSFEISGALTVLGERDGGHIESNLDELVVRRIAKK
jgi:hypothetical protein